MCSTGFKVKKKHPPAKEDAHNNFIGVKLLVRLLR